MLYLEQIEKMKKNTESLTSIPVVNVYGSVLQTSSHSFSGISLHRGMQLHLH